MAGKNLRRLREILSNLSGILSGDLCACTKEEFAKVHRARSADRTEPYSRPIPLEAIEERLRVERGYRAGYVGSHRIVPVSESIAAFETEQAVLFNTNPDDCTDFSKSVFYALRPTLDYIERSPNTKGPETPKVVE